MTHITDEAVEELSRSLIGPAWATFDEGLRNTLRGIHRAALEAALPHLEEATPYELESERISWHRKEGYEAGLTAAREGATPRKAFDVAYNIVNQLADLWEVPVDIRQATNDRCWEFAAGLIEGATPAIDREAVLEALKFPGGGCLP